MAFGVVSLFRINDAGAGQGSWKWTIRGETNR
jgi:hypothetical protein